MRDITSLPQNVVGLTNTQKVSNIDKASFYFRNGNRVMFNFLLNFHRKQTRTENKLKVEVKVLFFTISKKMESIQQSSSQKGFVVIDHYSSKTGQWRHVEFDASQYQKALTEVHRIEADMSTIPDVVHRTPFSQLSHMRVVAKPYAQENENVGLFIELQNDIKTLQIEIAESEALRTNEKTERLRSLLTELQSLTVKDCSWKILDNIKRNIK